MKNEDIKIGTIIYIPSVSLNMIHIYEKISETHFVVKDTNIMHSAPFMNFDYAFLSSSEAECYLYKEKRKSILSDIKNYEIKIKIAKAKFKSLENKFEYLRNEYPEEFL